MSGRKTGPIRAMIVALAMAGFAAPADLSAQNRELGSGGELLDSVVALVDDGIVLRSELRQRVEDVVRNFQRQQSQAPPAQRGQLPPLPVIEEQVLEQLVLREVQLQRAGRIGIQVGDDMLNQALATVARNLGLTLEQLPAALAQEGIDYQAYRETSREDLIINQLEQGEVMSRISVTPREMEQCLARRVQTQSARLDYNVSHILVGMPASPTPAQIADAQARVDEIYERLEAGTDFAQVALQYSDAQTALDGGSLGWRQGSALPTMFNDVVPRLEPGEVSEPIRTGSGFHIVRLNESRGAEPVMVEQLRVRHILLAPNELLDDDATRQKLIGLREQIIGGDDFGTVAISQSEDTESAADGGDLGWVTPDDFGVPEFGDKLRELDVGTLSEPFRTRAGWHIVEITDTRTHDTTDELERQECRQQIRSAKAQEEREMWLRRLRDQAYVDVRL